MLLEIAGVDVASSMPHFIEALIRSRTLPSVEISVWRSAVDEVSSHNNITLLLEDPRVLPWFQEHIRDTMSTTDADATQVNLLVPTRLSDVSCRVVRHSFSCGQSLVELSQLAQRLAKCVAQN